MGKQVIEKKSLADGTIVELVEVTHDLEGIVEEERKMLQIILTVPPVMSISFPDEDTKMLRETVQDLFSKIKPTDTLDTLTELIKNYTN